MAPAVDDVSGTSAGADSGDGHAVPNTSTCDGPSASLTRPASRSQLSPFGPASHYKEYETQNLAALGLLFSVYFAFRSSCLIVLPLACKLLLSDALSGADYSPLYQLPLALWFLMDIIIAVPNAMFMQRYGRRAGFMLGSAAALVASIGAFGVLRFVSNRVLAYVLLNSVVAVMSGIGMAEFVRFAAAEACGDEARRSKLVARVITGGAVVSMFGPFVSSLAVDIDPDHTLDGYAYFFLFMACFSVVALGAASMVRLPPMIQPVQQSQVRLRSIVSRKPVWSAILAQVAVQFTMVTPMAATPLTLVNHVGLHQGSFLISGCIVSHVMGMFLPGLLTGNIIEYCGPLPVMGSGLLLQAASLMVTMLGFQVANFYVGLVLLGVGWNFAFVSGTMLLLKSHDAEERTKVTAFNETLRFIANGAATVLSSSLSWDVMACTCLGFLVLMAGIMLLLLTGSQRRSEARALA